MTEPTQTPNSPPTAKAPPPRPRPKKAAAATVATASAAKPPPRKAPSKTAAPAVANGRVAAAPPAADAHHPAGDQDRTFSRLLWGAPPWLISTVAHFLLLVILALITIANQSEKKVELLVLKADDEEVEFEELTQVEFEVVEELEVEEMSLASAEFTPGMIEFGDVSTPADVANTALGNISLSNTSVAEIGSLFGKNGDGMVDVSGGLKGAATFFGSRAEGSRFAFVVDNSNSMGKGKFETAIVELIKAVRQLGPRQQFYVVFYSDTAYPLYYPQASPRMVPANEENKRMLESWLATVEMCLRTKGEDAMKLALAQRPDVLFLLGDGAFTDKTAELLVERPVSNVVIHTLGMQVKEQDALEFAAIAKAHRGTYRDVGVTPEGTAMLNRMGPRTRNNTPNGIWGIKLGDAKKKKK